MSANDQAAPDRSLFANNKAEGNSSETAPALYEGTKGAFERAGYTVFNAVKSAKEGVFHAGETVADAQFASSSSSHLLVSSIRMLVVVLLLLAAVVYYFGINRILGFPPGPPPLPILGNMLSFQWDMDKVFLDWKSRYGRIFTVWLPNPMIVIGDYKALQENVVKNGNVYIAKKNPEQMMDIWFGGNYGLGFQDNGMVKEQRKFALKTLHEIGFNSPALEDAVHNCALEVTSRWRNTAGATVDVTENIAKAVGNVIWKLTFGIELDFDNNIVPEFREIQQEFIPMLGGPLMMAVEMFPFLRKLDFLFGNHFQRLKTKLEVNNKIVKDAITTIETSFNPDNEPSSYVESFLMEMKKNEEAGKPEGNFHHRQLLASVSALWGAGFDTTVSTLRMCCLELISRPEIQTKLQKEIDDVIGERRVRYDDQKVLPYMCAFLQEIYRVGNVLPINFLRKTTQATEIEGWPVAAGTTVLPQFSMVHLDQNEFERPDYFCPERHIDSEGRFVKDPRITPFSIGARACLGETLARMEIFVLFTTFVQNCHFTHVGKVPPEVTFVYGFSRSVDNFSVKIVARN